MNEPTNISEWLIGKVAEFQHKYNMYHDWELKASNGIEKTAYNHFTTMNYELLTFAKEAVKKEYEFRATVNPAIAPIDLSANIETEQAMREFTGTPHPYDYSPNFTTNDNIIESYKINL